MAVNIRFCDGLDGGWYFLYLFVVIQVYIESRWSRCLWVGPGLDFMPFVREVRSASQNTSKVFASGWDFDGGMHL